MRVIAAVGLWLTTAGAVAQEVPLRDVPSGQVARSSVGQAGQRQTREQIAAKPMARIDSRIENRVQSRIRNRIDRFYDPRANATSPFKVASDQARIGR